MRKANDSSFIGHNQVVLGVNLGADFCAEHEWGIKGIRNLFQIPTGVTDFGLTRRKITAVPPSPTFGWTHGPDKKSEGFYLFETWDNKAPTFDHYASELRPYKATMGCAWDEKSFAVFSTDPEEIASLKQIYTAFQQKDGAIFLGGGGVFQNSGLCLVIASRLPQEFVDAWYKADKEAYDLEQEVESTGIRQLLKEKGKRYFALSRPHHRESDGKLLLWLNPCEQQQNNFGWYTIDDLRDWAENKGKIPVATGGKR